MDYLIKKEKKFRYIEQGEGHPIILLHGLFGALSNWKDVVEKFSSRYKMIIPLMPIYDLPVLLTNVRSLANFVHQFIKFKGYTSYSIIGNSLGGHVALMYVLKNPAYVKTLILTGSSGLYENSSMGGTYPKRGDYNFIKEKVEYTFYDPASANKELVDEVFEIVNNRIRLIKILALAKSAIRHNMAKDLPKIPVPTCLIWGREDKITPPEVAEEFHRLIRHSDLLWVDKCGHAPMMERPAEFNALLEPWLDSKIGH